MEFALDGLDSSEGCSMACSATTGSMLVCDSLIQAFVIQSDSGEVVSKIKEFYGLPVTALCFNHASTECAVAESASANIHSLPDPSVCRDALICRTNLPITHMEYDPTDAHIFIASGEPTIRVYSTALKRVVFSIDTFEEGVRSFSVSSCGGYLAVINESGTVLVFRLNRSSDKLSYLSVDLMTQVSHAVATPVVRHPRKIACALCWHPARAQLAVPHKTGSALLLSLMQEEDKWRESHLVAAGDTSHHQRDLCAALFSRSGDHLVTLDVEGGLLLWETSSEDAVRVLRAADGAPLLGLAWTAARRGGRLALLHSSGWTAVDVSEARALAPAEGSETQTYSQPADATQVASQASGAGRGGGAEDDDVSLEDAPAVSVRRIREEVLGDPADRLEAAAEEEEEEEGPSLVDEEQGLAYAAPVDLQPPFQPSSTTYDDFQRRFLVWNDVGNITTREEGPSNRVEIRFYNVNGVNKQQTFADTAKYSLASMSFEGAVFATELGEADPTDPSPVGSTVYYRPFPNHKVMEGANGEFTLSLMAGEGAVAVAAGRGWCAVATTRNYLRVFSASGLQLSVLCLAGPAVALAGLGSRLGVVYHRGPPLDDTPALETQVLDLHLDGKARGVLKCAVCLPTRSTLAWLGFDDRGALVYMDSAGTLFGLLNVCDWQCVPLLETAVARKSQDHVFWPVSVRVGKLFYILLNGESRPAIYPQPIMSSKALHVPVLECEVGRERDDLHAKGHAFALESMLRCHLDAERELVALSGWVPDGLALDQYEVRCDELYLLADKATLRMFVEACRLQRMPMAADLAKKLVQESNVEAAIVAANHYGRAPIARLLSDILEYKRSLREQPQQQEDQQETYSSGADAFAHNYSSEAQDAYENVDNYAARAPAQPPLFRPKSIVGSNAVVSPAPEDLSRIPPNPFARAQGQTPLKRKSAMDSIKDLKGSPSPKKPSIARESPFAQNARNKSKGDKVLL